MQNVDVAPAVGMDDEALIHPRSVLQRGIRRYGRFAVRAGDWELDRGRAGRIFGVYVAAHPPSAFDRRAESRDDPRIARGTIASVAIDVGVLDRAEDDDGDHRARDRADDEDDAASNRHRFAAAG